MIEHAKTFDGLFDKLNELIDVVNALEKETDFCDDCENQGCLGDYRCDEYKAAKLKENSNLPENVEFNSSGIADTCECSLCRIRRANHQPTTH